MVTSNSSRVRFIGQGPTGQSYSLVSPGQCAPPEGRGRPRCFIFSLQPSPQTRTLRNGVAPAKAALVQRH
jgi:hypothetical protein